MQATVLKSTACLLAALLSLFAVAPLSAQTASGSGDAALRAKIAELEGALRKLQAENALLRKQLAEPETAKPAEAPAKILPDGARWISTTGKRHNSSCRYFGQGKGRAGKQGEGVPCKVCGG
ncbi:hypothetical protein OVA24_15780 [Luteolibacter sp. SL250]|uniref:hypothetical protein n=1 Tax=Luteolibacter sp. SL250 TaxID=2995170 RepID=UPI00226F722B|nr:hypothetical protein [Luteolibacter sp. SL250]WAC18690.1 hypothetical protein OVA24_15780 [Luteolibacter sp. SL250]